VSDATRPELLENEIRQPPFKLFAFSHTLRAEHQYAPRTHIWICDEDGDFHPYNSSRGALVAFMYEKRKQQWGPPRKGRGLIWASLLLLVGSFLRALQDLHNAAWRVRERCED
jgi:hypothetical protein